MVAVVSCASHWVLLLEVFVRKKGRGCFALLMICKEVEHSAQGKSAFRRAARFAGRDKERRGHEMVGVLAILMVIPVMKKKADG